MCNDLNILDSCSNQPDVSSINLVSSKDNNTSCIFEELCCPHPSLYIVHKTIEGKGFNNSTVFIILSLNISLYFLCLTLSPKCKFLITVGKAVSIKKL